MAGRSTGRNLRDGWTTRNPRSEPRPQTADCPHRSQGPSVVTVRPMRHRTDKRASRRSPSSAYPTSVRLRPHKQSDAKAARAGQSRIGHSSAVAAQRAPRAQRSRIETSRLPLTSNNVVETMGLEPTTPCLQSRCSSQLSYVPSAETLYALSRNTSHPSRPVAAPYSSAVERVGGPGVRRRLESVALVGLPSWWPLAG